MKKYAYTNRILLVLIFFVQTSCEGIFIPDPIDPRLPKYTEEGNNVAGALIDNKIWKSVVSYGFPYNTGDTPSLTVWQEQDSLKLRFTGSSQGSNASVEFHMKGLGITKFEDLIDLEGQKISLDGLNSAGYYIEKYTPFAYDHKGIGQIYFRSIHLNDSHSDIIISGTFGFSLLNTHDRIIKITSGRFDYSINQRDFKQFDDVE